MSNISKSFDQLKIKANPSRPALLMPNRLGLKNLILLGCKGHFPLFHPCWIEAALKNKKKKIYNKFEDHHRFNRIGQALAQHQKLSRKQTLLESLPEKERHSFICLFMKLVEKKILSLKKESLH